MKDEESTLNQKLQVGEDKKAKAQYSKLCNYKHIHKEDEDILEEGRLLQKVKETAARFSDGHFTIFSFTTNYRGVYDTYSGESNTEFRHYLNASPAFGNLKDLYRSMVTDSHLHRIREDKQNPTHYLPSPYNLYGMD